MRVVARQLRYNLIYFYAAFALQSERDVVR